MATFPTKLLANVGATSPNTGGNQGWTSPLYRFQLFETGTPVAMTAVPLGVVPCSLTVVGVDMGCKTKPDATQITWSPLKMPAASAGTNVALTSTDGVVASTATTTNGPAYTYSYIWPGQSSATSGRGSNGAGTTTGVTQAVLSTTLASRQTVVGDLIGMTTAGTFTGLVGQFITIWAQEMNGTY